jgi:small subunit ribosomal protein S1
MVDEMNNELSEFEGLKVGDLITCTVTKIEEKHALVDAGYKTDGILPISELSSLHVEKVSDLLDVGDKLELKVTKVSDDELVLSKREVDSGKAWEDLKVKFEQKETLSVEVAEVVKGGLVIDLGVRGFIPASLVERHYVDDFSIYKGKELTVKIIEIDPENNKLILSHRAVLDESANTKKQETLESLQPGAVVEGTVQRLTDFGAFVDIGGVDGLVHISQIAHQRVEKPSDVVQEGQKVKVKILSIDLDNERISLSIKETQPGPWEDVSERIKAGDIIEGTVKRLVSFGAFVEVAQGVEGLVHISEIANKHIGTPQEVLSEGEKVKVKVLDINTNDKRISLSIRATEEQIKDEIVENYKNESETNTGFSLGDMIGDQLKKYKK